MEDEDTKAPEPPRPSIGPGSAMSEDAKRAAERILREVALHTDYGLSDDGSLLSFERDLETVARAYLAVTEREERLRAFAENIRDNWGGLTGLDIKEGAINALAAPDGVRVSAPILSGC